MISKEEMAAFNSPEFEFIRKIITRLTFKRSKFNNFKLEILFKVLKYILIYTFITFAWGNTIISGLTYHQPIINIIDINNYLILNIVLIVLISRRIFSINNTIPDAYSLIEDNYKISLTKFFHNLYYSMDQLLNRIVFFSMYLILVFYIIIKCEVIQGVWIILWGFKVVDPNVFDISSVTGNLMIGIQSLSYTFNDIYFIFINIELMLIIPFFLKFMHRKRAQIIVYTTIFILFFGFSIFSPLFNFKYIFMLMNSEMYLFQLRLFLTLLCVALLIARDVILKNKDSIVMQIHHNLKKQSSPRDD